jgi:efflux ABC transporter, permease protein
VLSSLYACLSVVNSSRNLENSLYKASNSSFSIVKKDSQGYFSYKDVKNIQNIKEIKESLLEYEGLAKPKNAKAISANQQVQRDDLNEDLKNTVAIHSANNTAKNTLFSSGVFELKQGRHLEQNDKAKVLIHEAFAQKNNLKIGDKIELSLINASGKKTETQKTKFEIIGIFSGKKQEKYTGLSSDFSENTIFSDFETTMRSLNLPEDKDLLSKITLYTETADQLDKAIAKTEKLNIDWSKYKIEKNNAAFKDSLESIAGVKNIINLMTYLIIIGGSVVLSLILMLWLRERIYEIGILLSIGASKLHIVSQFIIELVLISIPTMIISFILGNLVFSLITKGLSETEETSSIVSSFTNNIFGLDSLAVFTQSYSILITIIILSVITASMMILVKKPKEILSKIS